MEKETAARGTQRKAMFFSCGLCLSVLVWALFSACSDPAKQPKALNVELVYSGTFRELQSRTVQVFTADGIEIKSTQEPNALTKDEGKGQTIQVDCSEQPTRSKPPTHFLHAKAFTKNGQSLEGKVALSKEVCDAGLAKIVMMIPERIGQLIAKTANTGEQVGLIEVAGVFGHASAVLGDGRALVMGGVSQFSQDTPKQGLLPFVWRLGDSLYRGAENSEVWLYDADAATLRSGKVEGEQGLLGRAFHSLTVQGNKAWALGGWLPLGPLPSQGWLPTISFTFPVVSAQSLYTPSEASLLVEKLVPSPFRSVGHLAFSVNTNTNATPPAIAVIGGRQAHPNDDPILPPTPVPPIRRDNACRDDEERVFLTMHAASLLPNGQELVVAGGLWTRVDGSLLPPRFSNVVWRASLANLQGQAAFCAKISSRRAEEGIRVIFASGGSLSVSLGGLPEGMIGHSMTLVGKHLLVYGGISLPSDVWPWRDEEAVSDEDIYQKGFVSIREDAFWLSAKDDGTFKVNSILFQEGTVTTEKGCRELGMVALNGGGRAIHQATRLLDGRILLSGGLRCLPRSPGVPPQEGCVVGGSLHPRPILLYTPKDENMESPPSSLLYRCVQGGGSHDSQNPPIQRLFHTALRLPSGRVLLWGGLTSDANGLLLKKSMPVEVFSPSLGKVSDPNPQENNQDGGGPEGIGPDAGTPEDIRPDAKPPVQTLMRHFAVVEGDIKNVRTLIARDQVISLFFALKGSIQRHDRSPLYSADGGKTWSLVRMRLHADFQKDEWVEYDNAIVIPKITDTAQWDVALNPNNTNNAFVVIRCSDAISKELLLDPDDPRVRDKVQLCQGPSGEVGGLAVLNLDTIVKHDVAKTYVYGPLSARVIQGELSLRRLRVRGGVNMDLALFGTAKGALAFQNPLVRWGHTLPQQGADVALILRLQSAGGDFEALSMVFSRPSVGVGEIVDMAWLEDTSDTRCFLAKVKGTGSFEAMRSDSPSPPVGVGGFNNLLTESVFVSCYAGVLDGTFTGKVVQQDASLPNHPKRLLAIKKGGDSRLYVSLDTIGAPKKPRVLVLSPVNLQILDVWELDGGAQSEMVAVSDTNGSFPLYLGQSASTLPWNGAFTRPSWFLYAPESPSKPQGYAFPLVGSALPSDYWLNPFVERSSLASKDGMIAVSGLMNSGEEFDVSISKLPSVQVGGVGLFLWARQALSEKNPPLCDLSKPTLAASCSCAENCVTGCCGPLGICRNIGHDRVAEPLPFYCGAAKQSCNVCDRKVALGCNAAGSCADCRSGEVELKFDGNLQNTKLPIQATAGQEVSVEVNAYRHPILPVPPPGMHQSLVVGIVREGYGAEAWGCVYAEKVDGWTCDGAKAGFKQIDRSGRPIKVKLPLWLSRSADYRVVAKVILGNFLSCEGAIESFEAMSPDELLKGTVGTLQIDPQMTCSTSSYAFEKIELQADGTLPISTSVRTKKGGTISLSLTARFRSSLVGWLSFAFVDGLGNKVGPIKCFGPVMGKDYCPPNSPKNTGFIDYPLPAGLGVGRYFFRASFDEKADCTETMPATMSFPRAATVGEVQVDP